MSGALGGRAGAARGFASLTVDLDSLACYREIHGLSPADLAPGDADPAYSVGVRRLLDFFAEFGVASTLFVVGADAERSAHAALLDEASEAGHELGNHSYSHFYDLPRRSLDVQREEIARAEAAIARVAGQRPVGYRAPGYNIGSGLLKVLAERDYLYDSSVFACPPYYAAKGAIMGWRRLRARPSRSAMVDPRTLLAPLQPYRPASEQIWRADANSGLPLEVPMCLVPGARFPIIGTSLHLLGKTGFDLMLPVLRRGHPQIFQLEFHAIDFMDAADLGGVAGATQLIAAQPDLRISWPQKRELYAHIVARLGECYDFATLRDAVIAIQNK